MNRNPNFTKEIMTTPDPNRVDGLYFQKSYFDMQGKYGMKIWKKVMTNKGLKYMFWAIYDFR